MRAFFEGRRELFRGLEIERLEEEATAREGREPWAARPVLHISFNGADYTREGGLEGKLDAVLADFEDAWGVERRSDAPGPRFQRVLAAAHASSGYRVAVLVDECEAS